MSYIPYKQMQQLREAARNGDERAKKIIRAQLDDEDFSSDLEEYFKPQPKEEEIEEVVEAPVEDVKQEETQTLQDKQKDISQAILDLVGLCDAKTLEIVNDKNISDATKKGSLSILGEIKQSCLDNLEKFGKLMSSLQPKEEKEKEIVEENL